LTPESVAATCFSPVSGSTRVMRGPCRSVTQSAPSGPQTMSQGNARPAVSVLTSNGSAAAGAEATPGAPPVAAQPASPKAAAKNSRDD